jgi:type II secretory pathway pseudopilin PulG
MTKRIEWQSEQGSSLIEIIISILVITIVSMSLMHSFYRAEQATDVSGRRLIASNLAREIAEEWKKADFDHLVDELNDKGTGSPKTLELFDQLPTQPKTYTINNNKYHSFVTIRSLAGDARLGDVSPYILRLTVTVFWTLDNEAVLDDANSTPEQKKALITRRTSSTVEAFITEEGIRR